MEEMNPEKHSSVGLQAFKEAEWVILKARGFELNGSCWEKSILNNTE